MSNTYSNIKAVLPNVSLHFVRISQFYSSPTCSESWALNINSRIASFHYMLVVWRFMGDCFALLPFSINSWWNFIERNKISLPDIFYFFATTVQFIATKLPSWVLKSLFKSESDFLNSLTNENKKEENGKVRTICAVPFLLLQIHPLSWKKKLNYLDDAKF